MTDEEKKYYSYNIPSVLVMNKVDLVTSKRRLRTLQDELQDLCSFEKVFHVSTITGFGIDALKEFVISKG
jgi:GTP-binding protein Era